MGHELESLERRINSLEDVEIEVMERLEEAQTTLDSTATELATTEQQLADATTARDTRATDINEE
ncbi:MAG: hypothetical protein ABWX84_00650, partial [Nocardioides sp.]